MHPVNHQYRLAARPHGLPKKTDWSYVETATPLPGDDQMLVKVLYVSLDPAMRGWMNEQKSYVPPVNLGEVMRALAVGKVVQSKNTRFSQGDFVSGMFGVQEYALSDGKGVMKIDPRAAPLPAYLSVLGMPGMTAYFGLLEVGQPKAGDTLVVSGAAGAVGALVGQIAKVKGCRVVGIAGGAEKCAYVTRELGFDAAIDYKTEDVKVALGKHCPQGVDVYFDNVGGDILDAVLLHLAMKARIVICGAISQYNATTVVKGPANYLSLLVNRARMEGMIVFDYMDRYPEGGRAMATMLAKGQIKSKEDVAPGLVNFPEVLLRLFKGENFGKLVLEVAKD